MNLKDKFHNCATELRDEFIRNLEFDQSLDFLERFELLSEVISNLQEYDLARIEALKILEFAELTEPQKIALFEDLKKIILNDDEEYLVKQYAVMACGNLVRNNAHVFTFLLELLSNQKEDIDLRYNAYGAILQHEDKEVLQNCLRELLADPIFSKSARRDLEEALGSSRSGKDS